MRVYKNLIFFAGLVLLIILLSAFFNPKDNTKMAGIVEQKARGFLTEEKNSLDVIILGDSESFTAFSPMELWKNHGYTSYVCGMSGERVWEAYSFLTEVLKTQSPKIVIVETNMFYTYSQLNDELERAVYEFGNRQLKLLRYHDRWKEISNRDFDLKVDYTWMDFLKGFSYKPAVVPYEDGEYMTESDEADTIEYLPLYYLNQIQKTCKKNNIKLMLVSAPSPKNWNYRRHNGVEDWAKETNTRYLDLNLKVSDIQINWLEDSLDGGDHLNFNGAVKTTRYLGEYLSENYNLKDHRRSDQYNSWDKSLEQYERLINQ